MLVDLHNHYPMHLVGDEEDPHEQLLKWWESVRDQLYAGIFSLAARLINNRGWGTGWRVDLAGLERGEVGIVCSVLYWPFGEIEPGTPYGSPPNPGTFAHLIAQLDDVEAHLATADPAGTKYAVVRAPADLDGDQMRFVHCVEGGFHLSPDPAEIDAQIATLAQRGVFYITLAHLFYRGVATDTPAIPPLTDEEYNAVFRQPEDVGLTQVGVAAVEAMWKHKVLVDLSHMRANALTQTFDELDRLDPAKTLPVIASHVAAASEGPHGHAYNFTPETMQKVKERGGVIGLITAQHLLGTTHTPAESKALLGRHIAAIHDALGSHDYTAIGSDLDGFIKPTITGVERAEDLATLQQWVRELVPGAAEAILHANAERVLRKTFALRAAR
jgi:microsomal dipeptidase-like Zn-dependent dipeptidase